MSESIKSIQRLVGTDPDGAMGPKTRAAMAGRTEQEILHPWALGAPLVHTAARGSREVRYIVVHHSDTKTVDGMVRALNAAPKKNKSTHYSVDKDGTIREHVDPWAHVTWHCVGANMYGIGLDVIHKHGESFTPEQVASLGTLLRWLCTAFGLPQVVAPGRVKLAKGAQLAKQPWGVCGHGDIQATLCPDGAPIAQALAT